MKHSRHAHVDAQEELTRYSAIPEGHTRASGDPAEPHLATFLFNRSAIAYDGLKAQWKRAMGLSTNERMAVAHLWESGSMTMGELGDKLDLSRAAMTAMVDRLVASGYLQRETDALDRRRTILRMTDKAAGDVIPLAIPFTRDVLRRIEDFGEAEWQAVVRFLDVLHDEAHNHASRLSELEDEEVRELAVRLRDRAQ